VEHVAGQVVAFLQHSESWPGEPESWREGGKPGCRPSATTGPRRYVNALLELLPGYTTTTAHTAARASTSDNTTDSVPGTAVTSSSSTSRWSRQQRSGKMTTRARGFRHDQRFDKPHDHVWSVPALAPTCACRRSSAPTHRDFAGVLAGGRSTDGRSSGRSVGVGLRHHTDARLAELSRAIILSERGA